MFGNEVVSILIKKKGLKEFTVERVKEAFGSSLIKVLTSVEEVQTELYMTNWQHKNLLLMSSGNFAGLNFQEFSKKILSLSV